MARRQEQAPRAQRLVALAAVGFLAVATALAFGRVFLGRGPTWKLLAAALASAVLAMLLERRGLLLATFASAACLLAAVGLLVFPKTTLWGLPTMETLRTIGTALGEVGEQARVQISPTLPLPPLLLAAVTATWTATFSAHALAVRAGSPLLATLPSIALVGFADTVLEDGARPFYALLFLTAALAVIFVDGLRRVRQWGPVWPWPGRSRRLSTTTTRGARRVAVLAVGVAALIPGILPGFRSGPLLDLAGSDSSGRIDPLVSIKAQLERERPIALFEVEASAPAYWRWLSLERFDGIIWSTEDLDLTNGQVFETPASLPRSFPVGGEVVQQTYHVLNEGAVRWLPMAYPATSVQLPGGTLRYDEALGAAVVPDGLTAGQSYTVTSQLVEPSPAQLDLQFFGPPSTYGGFATPPSDTPQEIFDIAERWTAGEPTPFRKILAIQNHFLDGSFEYSLDVNNESGSNALVGFLTLNKRGFCQQFASAMAVLVRALGYPARVAVGFTTGTRVPGENTYRVTTLQAHSWVEVLFPDYGWLAFEPTPGRDNPVAASYLDPEADANCFDPLTCGPGNPQGGVIGQPEGIPGQLFNSDGELRGVEVRGGRAGRSGTSSTEEPQGFRIPYGLLIRVLLVLLGVLLVIFPLVKLAWREHRLRRVKEPGPLVLATYRLFADEAADLGLARGEGETISEYARRLQEIVGFSDGHVDRLSRIASRAAYSPRPVSETEAREARESARVAIRDMRRDAGPARRIAGIYRPRV